MIFSFQKSSTFLSVTYLIRLISTTEMTVLKTINFIDEKRDQSQKNYDWKMKLCYRVLDDVQCTFYMVEAYALENTIYSIYDSL